MSAWTWTMVKASVVPEDTVENLLERAECSIKNKWYFKGSQTEDGYNEVLKEWIEIQKEYEDDYYISELKMKKEECTDEFYKKKLDLWIERDKNNLADIEKIRNKEMTFVDFLKKHIESDGLSSVNSNIMCRILKGNIYVEVPSIFRLREYSDMSFYNGLSTVDSLIEYLKEPYRQEIITDYLTGTTGLTESLEKRIREFYGKFGDGNFTVHFG